MSTLGWVIIFICAMGCACLLVLLISLMKAAAPRNSREQARDDYEQMKALGYFNNTITSGCPVMKEPK